MGIKRRLIGLGVAVALIGGAPAAPAAVSADPPIARAAKSCSSGYTHAVIRGSHKCLRRGQFCARSADRQYHRYGYHCHRSGRLS